MTKGCKIFYNVKAIVINRKYAWKLGEEMTKGCKIFYNVKAIVINRKYAWKLICTFFIIHFMNATVNIYWQGQTKRFVPIHAQYEGEEFQMVADNRDLMVYSAYFEERLRHIRVIGIAGFIPSRVFCHLRYHNTSSIYIEGHIEKLRDTFNRRYRSVFILCLIDHLEVPNALTISTDTNFEDAKNVIQVRRIPNDTIRRNFTLCVSPVKAQLTNPALVLEWFEMNIILGVEKFIVYAQNSSKEIMKIFELYQFKKYVVIKKWDLPDSLCKLSYQTDVLLHYCGQLAALNDCLYHVKGYSKYVAVFDMDEFIIPQTKEDKTWMDLFQRLPESNAYIFRNVFFTGNDTAIHSLITQSCFLRQNYTYGSHRRSKYIAATNNTEIMGIHFTFKMTGREHTVSPSVGLLHHYRQEHINEYTNKYIKSDVMKKYESDLQQRLLQIGIYTVTQTDVSVGHDSGETNGST